MESKEAKETLVEFRLICICGTGLLCMLLRLLHRYSVKAFVRCYDAVLVLLLCALMLPGCQEHYLGQALGANVPSTAYGESTASVIMMFLMHLGGFLELRFPYYIIFAYLMVAVQIAFNILFGTDPMNAQQRFDTLLFSHFCHILIFVNFYTEEGVRRDLFRAQTDLEAHASKSLALAEVEHKAAIGLKEQEALLSFVRSVFDIFGNLIFASADEFDEPRLHFESEPNAALDELLEQSSARKPLDMVLGPMPMLLGDVRERWQQERQRLWSYAALEATKAADEPTEHSGVQGKGLARKIALTCTPGEGRAQSIELFIQRSGDRVLFGILLGAAERLPPPASEVEVAASCHGPRSQWLPASAKSISDASSTSSVPSSPNRADGAVSVWINAEDRGILKRTKQFDAWFNGPGALKIDGEFERVINDLLQFDHPVGRRCEASVRLNGQTVAQHYMLVIDAKAVFEVLAPVDGTNPVMITIISSWQPRFRRLTSARHVRHRRLEGEHVVRGGKVESL